MAEVTQFVRRHASKVTPAVIKNLLVKLPMLKVEFTQIEAPAFPHLVDQLEFLADVVEDYAEGADDQIPLTLVADAVFALLYAHQHYDIIPDAIPEMGHADDSAVVRWVLIEHERELAAYALRHELDWTAVTSQP